MVCEHLHPDQEEDLPEIDEIYLPDPVVDDEMDFSSDDESEDEAIEDGDDPEEVPPKVDMEFMERFHSRLQMLQAKTRDDETAWMMEARALIREIIMSIDNFETLRKFSAIFNSAEQQSQ